MLAPVLAAGCTSTACFSSLVNALMIVEEDNLFATNAGGPLGYVVVRCFLQFVIVCYMSSNSPSYPYIHHLTYIV